MIRVSAGQAVLIHVGMMSCQVEQACLCCREVARLHEVVQGRMTAGTFVQQACAESVAVSGAHKSLVSVLRAAQVRSVSIFSCLINSYCVSALFISLHQPCTAVAVLPSGRPFSRSYRTHAAGRVAVRERGSRTYCCRDAEGRGISFGVCASFREGRRYGRGICAAAVGGVG